jgi:hypothetical protein
LFHFFLPLQECLRLLTLIYLLTATGFTPGGCCTVHIYTQTIHRTTQYLTGKNAVRAPSLRVITWHLPYNWGKKTKKPQYTVQFHHFIFLLTLALEKYRLCCCFDTITLDLLNNTPHCALYTTIATPLSAFVAFSKFFSFLLLWRCRWGLHPPRCNTVAYPCRTKTHALPFCKLVWS